TDKWLGDFEAHRVLPDDLPPVSELEKFLLGPLPVKIGVPPGLLDVWYSVTRIESKVLKNTFESSRSKPCVTFLERVWHHSVYVPQVPASATKTGCIWFWDRAIRQVLDFALLGANKWSTRFSLQAPFNGSTLPDFTLFIDSICVLRGEEQGPSEPI
ncbi:hypothetical protein PHYSODRAFT_438150, partial [Phytophthora sojae]